MFFKKQGSRQNWNIPRTANFPKLFFPDSFLKLNYLYVHVKKNNQLIDLRRFEMSRSLVFEKKISKRF